MPAAIRVLASVSGATEVTLVLDIEDALDLAGDIDWAARTRDGGWTARKIVGAIREEGC